LSLHPVRCHCPSYCLCPSHRLCPSHAIIALHSRSPGALCALSVPCTLFPPLMHDHCHLHPSWRASSFFVRHLCLANLSTPSANYLPHAPLYISHTSRPNSSYMISAPDVLFMHHYSARTPPPALASLPLARPCTTPTLFICPSCILCPHACAPSLHPVVRRHCPSHCLCSSRTITAPHT
jgi:hypothetical protein